MRAVTVPASSTTMSSSVATVSVAVMLPASKVAVPGREPPRIEPVAVTSTETVRGSERGRLVEAVRESVYVASVPSTTLLPGAMVTTGVSGTSLGGIVTVCVPRAAPVKASCALTVIVSATCSMSASSTARMVASAEVAPAGNMTA